MKTLIFKILFLTISVNLFSQNDVLFKDNFDTNKNSWWIGNNEDAVGKISSGKYIMEHKNGFGAYYFWTDMVLDPKADYLIEIKVKQTKGADNDNYGIVWGARGWGDSYNFLISSDGTFNIGGYKNKKEFSHISYSKPGLILAKGNYNVLTIKKIGNIIKFYINGKSVYQYGAESFFGSLHGFVVGGKMEIEADYFSIKYPKRAINLINAINPAFKKKNLGNRVNSVYSEIAPVISPDGQTLYVARQGHPSNEGPEKLYDIWYTTRQTDDSWGPLVRMGKPINNEGDNLVISVSPDGNTLLLEGLYAPNGSYISDQGISISHRTGKGWSMPKKILIKDFYNLNEYESYCPTADRSILIMSVERKDTYGQKDLYVSFKNKDGDYSIPLNMGPELNTFLNEGTPFIAPDNKTLYFYSYAHPGYGSADIFVSKRLDDTWTKWSKPKNLGPGINSSDWDTYYSISAKGDYAYLVSARNSFGNEDVFEIKLSEDARPDPVVLVYGNVIDNKTKKPISVVINYEELNSNKNTGEARSNPGDGAYKIVLPYGKVYELRAEADGYIAVSEEIDLTKIAAYKEVKRDLYLIPIEKGAVIKLKSVQFERNTDKMIESSFLELDRLVDILKKYHKMEIELSGHTDTRGNPDHLYQLSVKRVAAVKDYLIKHGIAASRITGKGYGGTKPLGTGNEAIEIKNRRVEFKIVNM